MERKCRRLRGFTVHRHSSTASPFSVRAGMGTGIAVLCESGCIAHSGPQKTWHGATRDNSVQDDHAGCTWGKCGIPPLLAFPPCGTAHGTISRSVEEVPVRLWECLPFVSRTAVIQKCHKFRNHFSFLLYGQKKLQDRWARRGTLAVVFEKPHLKSAGRRFNARGGGGREGLVIVR
jgi:hypothetical protein